VSNVPEGLTRYDAFNLGVVRAIQALTAVVYRTSSERELIEKQLQVYLQDSTTGMDATQLEFYRSPIEGALQVIEQIKATQPK
jgi:hypothetical protein